MNYEFLKQLTECDGASSFENEVREIFKQETSSLELPYIEDQLGSCVAKLETSNAIGSVLVAGHFDEVGFMVKRIDDNGFIYFATVGGWVPHVLLAQRVRITNNEGKKFVGVIGSRPPHIMKKDEREKLVEIDKMFIDLGVASKQEVLDLGIEVGNMITPVSEFTIMNNPKYLLAKAWDNRVGVALSTEILQELADEKLNVSLYAGGSVQEEVGLRGARTIAETIKPTIAIAIDTGLTGDVPGVSETECQNELGKGPVLSIFDAGQMIPQNLKKYIDKIAKQENINVQYDIMQGGATDAGNFQYANAGTLSCAISLATRYIHSHTSIIHEDDYLATKKLIKALIKSLDEETIKELTGK